MKAGREEEKLGGGSSSSPMFPRLHVNDTEKGGPRAPPRNKMALYEQLSIPSQRFNSSSLPLPLQSARSQGNRHEGNMLSSFRASPTLSVHSVEKVNSRSSDGENVRTSKKESERASKHVNFRPANSVGSVAESSSLHHRDPSVTRNPCRQRVDEDDDFTVPTFVNSENALHLNKDISGIEMRRLTPLRENSLENNCPATFKSSAQLPNFRNRPLEETITSEGKSGKHEGKCNQTFLGKQIEITSSQPEVGEKLTGSSRFVVRENAGSHGICQESFGDGAPDETVDRIEPQSKTSPSHESIRVAGNRTSDRKRGRSSEFRDGDVNNDEISDTSMVDSVSGLGISPDNVVGVIGPKQFWKARRAIVNQQRVFDIQVFELHRLIKVQKLLAASPHLLLDDNSSVTPQKVPVKNLPLEPYSKAHPQSTEQKDDTQNPIQIAEYQTESTEVASLPAHNNVANNDALPRDSNPTPASENRSSPWCFQPPPAHQWLVPVMSPSEGLIYKPYPGPCPPVYGNCGPMSLPAGYPVPPQPFSSPVPYGLPAMSPMVSNSAVEQMGPMAGWRPNTQTEQNSRSSCNMSFPKSDAFTGRPWKVHASKDSELQGSTASSPCDRDPLPLFPTGPTAETSAQPSESNGKEQPTHVIRVVPHNARSATESAARIFRSIQEERQQLDL